MIYRICPRCGKENGVVLSHNTFTEMYECAHCQAWTPCIEWREASVAYRKRDVTVASLTLRPSLFYQPFLRVVNSRLILGAEKHGEWVWQDSFNPRYSTDALLHHIDAHLQALKDGAPDRDQPELGPIAHVCALVCNLMFLYWRINKYPLELEEYVKCQS